MLVRQERPTGSLNRIYYPEDRLPLAKLIPMGIQQVLAMFGGTVLAPILMGFDPQITLFFSDLRIYYPEDRLPLAKLIPMGIQQVLAMFGGTVLAPILMGFDPQITLFFS